MPGLYEKYVKNAIESVCDIPLDMDKHEELIVLCSMFNALFHKINVDDIAVDIVSINGDYNIIITIITDSVQAIGSDDIFYNILSRSVRAKFMACDRSDYLAMQLSFPGIWNRGKD